MTKLFKVVVAGSRSFDDYTLLTERLDYYLANKSNIEIVSGTAQGADRLGERYATEHNIPIKRFPADWNLHGKSAGYKRNKQMAEYADAVVVFWDGQSKGAMHMYNLAKQAGKPVRLVQIKLNITT